MDILNDSLIGKYVILRDNRFGGLCSGRYIGNHQWEKDGTRYHYFRGGTVGVTDQGNGMHGFPVARIAEFELVEVLG